MEPFSALAAATSVVQFIDFSCKVITGSRELFNSATGQFIDHKDLENITKHLISLSGPLQKPVHDSRRVQGDQLQPLCKRVNEVAGELISTLDSLRVTEAKKSARWESCYKALRSVWSQQQIALLQDKLNGFRQQLTLSVLVVLREEFYSAHKSSNDQANKLHNEFLKYINENRQWRTEITQAIREHYSSDANYDSNVFSPRAISTFGLQDSLADFTRYILYSLRFRTIDDRHERIADAERQTFEWIFSESNPEGTSWTNFTQWLQSPSNLYWITGKAGSGKSTLMKLLRDDQRTKYLLSSSTNLPIVEAGFFFWNSGSEMQMSQEGLLRTLLCQILEQCKDLTPIAFPDLWESFSLLSIVPAGDWSWTELYRAFRRLTERVCSSKLLFLLIDGLDEYNGNHSDIISLLKELATQSSNIKICVASRPWVIFEDAFQRTPSLLMQELTFPDIVLYTSTKLEDNLGFSELKKDEPEYSEQLVMEIAEKASGVFLWVVLVVRSLLIGLTNGDRISDLQERLAALPADLEDLFQRIIDDIEPMYKRQASELFQIFRAATEPPTILTFAFADQPDIESALRHPVGKLEDGQLFSKLERTRRRLNSRCRGLLEVSEQTSERPTSPTSMKVSRNSCVSYLHRTVKDFMEDESRWKKITDITPASFDPNLHLSKSYLMQLKTHSEPIDAIDAPRPLQQLMSECLNYVSVARESLLDIKISLADELDKTLCTLTSTEVESGKTLCEVNAATYDGVDPCWTHIKAIVSGKMEQPGTFVNYMIWTGRHWYAQAKITQGLNVQQAKPLVPLLVSAMDTNMVTVRQAQRPVEISDDVEFIAFLLDHGADPNEEFQGLTPFSLTWAITNYAARKKIQTLLRHHGAKEVQSDEYYIKSVRRSLSREEMPNEVLTTDDGSAETIPPKLPTPWLRTKNQTKKVWSLRRFLFRSTPRPTPHA